MDIASKSIAALQQVSAKAQAGAKSPDAAEKVSKEFEAVFLTEVIDEMFKNVNIGNFGGGYAEETWRSFLAQAYADQLAGQGSTGIARNVLASIRAYEQATKAQEIDQ